MSFNRAKIESIEQLDVAGTKWTMGIGYIFKDEHTLIGTTYCDRAYLLYNNDAHGVSNDPYYRLSSIIESTIDDIPVCQKTIEKWYDDVPIYEPLAYIADEMIV